MWETCLHRNTSLKLAYKWKWYVREITLIPMVKYRHCPDLVHTKLALPSTHTVHTKKGCEYPTLCLSPFNSYHGNTPFLEFNFPNYLEAKEKRKKKKKKKAIIKVHPGVVPVSRTIQTANHTCTAPECMCWNWVDSCRWITAPWGERKRQCAKQSILKLKQKRLMFKLNITEVIITFL